MSQNKTHQYNKKQPKSVIENSLPVVGARDDWIHVAVAMSTGGGTESSTDHDSPSSSGESSLERTPRSHSSF